MPASMKVPVKESKAMQQQIKAIGSKGAATILLTYQCPAVFIPSPFPCAVSKEYFKLLAAAFAMLPSFREGTVDAAELHMMAQFSTVPLLCKVRSAASPRSFRQIVATGSTEAAPCRAVFCVHHPAARPLAHLLVPPGGDAICGRARPDDHPDGARLPDRMVCPFIGGTSLSLLHPVLVPTISLLSTRERLS